MSTRAVCSVDAAVAQLTEAVAAARAAATSERVSADALAALLRLGDEVTATAVGVLTGRRDAIARETGVSTEMHLQLAGRRVGWEARQLTGSADVLRSMPQLADALASGVVSWSQAREIIREARELPAEARASLDALVGERAPELAASDPERVVWEARDLAAQLSVEREQRREQQAIEQGFLTLQPRLEGGGSFYGEADAEAFNSLALALDAAAERPARSDADEDEPEEPTRRAQQHLQALRSICETYLAGGATGSQAKPRIYLAMDARDPQSLAVGAQLLSARPGKPLRLTPLSTERLMCDAEVIPIVFKDGQPIGIGDTRKGVPAKIRAALVARDAGCRFPGCDAPQGWCDSHHVQHRGRNGDNAITNQALFCRRCHNRIHHQGWTIQMLDAGVISFTRRGKRYLSHPRARPPTNS